MRQLRVALGILTLTTAISGPVVYAETWPGEEPPEDKDTEWIKIEIPGTVCGNGSPYKFFVHYAMYNNNLMVIKEQGGACWDHAGCSGRKPLGASHPNGIPDDMMTNITSSINSIQSPFTWRNHPWSKVEPGSWNKVFLPYCTGDVFVGDTVTTYEDPTGEFEPLTYHHKGHANMKKVIEWVANEFPEVGRFMSTGASAGGAGSLINYHLWREELNILEDSILLNDSGPIFRAYSEDNSPSFLAQKKFVTSWNVQPLIDSITDEARQLLEKNQAGDYDFGSINTMLAQLYPQDRLIQIMFTMDEVYSAYMYGEFFSLNWNSSDDRSHINQLWRKDQSSLIEQYEQWPNLHYFMPYYRKLGFSHCSTVIDFNFSDISLPGGNQVSLKDYFNDLLDLNKPMKSYVEFDNPDDLNKSNTLHDAAHAIFKNSMGR